MSNQIQYNSHHMWMIWYQSSCWLPYFHPYILYRCGFIYFFITRILIITVCILLINYVFCLIIRISLSSCEYLLHVLIQLSIIMEYFLTMAAFMSILPRLWCISEWFITVVLLRKTSKHMLHWKWDPHTDNFDEYAQVTIIILSLSLP